MLWDPPSGVVNGREVPQRTRLRPKKLVKQWKIRTETSNVGTLTGRLREIKRRIDFYVCRRLDGNEMVLERFEMGMWFITVGQDKVEM